MAKGFDVIQSLAETTSKDTFTAAEISKAFIDKGSTSGAATGTIRRACDLGLLTKIGYGKYKINSHYNIENNNLACGIVLKGIVQNAIDAIDRNFSATTLLQLTTDELTTVKHVLSSLQEIINKI